VSRQTIISIENGRYNPSLELAWRLSKALGISIEDLFDFGEVVQVRTTRTTMLLPAPGPRVVCA